MAKWEVGSWSFQHTLDCEGVENPVAIIPDEMVATGREIARKLNVFDEMLAALKDAQSVLDGEHPDWADFYGPEFESITKAIAKAKGE